MQKQQWTIAIYSAAGYPCGTITGVKKEVISTASERMPWLPRTEILQMTRKAS